MRQKERAVWSGLEGESFRMKWRRWREGGREGGWEGGRAGGREDGRKEWRGIRNWQGN